MGNHFLNLRALPDPSLEEYLPLSFEGREAISEPFDYRLELITSAKPELSEWIGKLCEFEIDPHNGNTRVFAGRIYAARYVLNGDGARIHLQIGPAYQALAYARATHFIQDLSSLDIFEKLTHDVTGLVTTTMIAGPLPTRGYSVRYDETEIDFLARLLAQDGIMYFFRYDRNSGAFRHEMIVTSETSAYVDIAAEAVRFLPNAKSSAVDQLEHAYRAGPRSHSHGSFNVNKLDTPFIKTSEPTESWGAVYSHAFETTGFEARDERDVESRETATNQRHAQSDDRVVGQSTEPTFMAGGRVEIIDAEGIAPRRVVLTEVVHSAIDPWMLPGADTARYTNSFVAIDAGKVYRPEVGTPARIAPGPLLGVVGEKRDDDRGETIVDDQSRIPVIIANARDYTSQGLPDAVWLPVRQQWAHATHGAQFFPRTGARVIVDFLYGNPDLPFVSGTIYTPSQPYPFPPREGVKNGWRSVTDRNGSITQEFLFNDKESEEEIYLYTGRDYRRVIDQDDWGTVRRHQTLEVVKNRKRSVGGDETVDVTGKRTVTVTGKNLLESLQEVEIKVAESSIKLTPSGITIKAPMITIEGQASVKVTAPKTDVNGDAMLTLKGGITMIN